MVVGYAHELTQLINMTKIIIFVGPIIGLEMQNLQVHISRK